MRRADPGYQQIPSQVATHWFHSGLLLHTLHGLRETKHTPHSTRFWNSLGGLPSPAPSEDTLPTARPCGLLTLRTAGRSAAPLSALPRAPSPQTLSVLRAFLNLTHPSKSGSHRFALESPSGALPAEVASVFLIILLAPCSQHSTVHMYDYLLHLLVYSLSSALLPSVPLSLGRL